MNVSRRATMKNINKSSYVTMKAEEITIMFFIVALILKCIIQLIFQRSVSKEQLIVITYQAWLSESIYTTKEIHNAQT